MFILLFWLFYQFISYLPILQIYLPISLIFGFCLLSIDGKQAARDGFCLQINKLTDIERDTSISINRVVDLAKTALHIAAEDDSLISHSSVPLPVDDFINRLDDLSMGYCSQYGSSFRYSPEKFLESLDKYFYIDKVCSLALLYFLARFFLCHCLVSMHGREGTSNGLGNNLHEL